MLSKMFVYNKSCVGTPRKEDIKITEIQLKPLKDGGKLLTLCQHVILLFISNCVFVVEFLAEAAFISVEPFSPLLSENFEKDGIVQGFQVAK